jgi:hypothetical protein
MVGTVLLVAGYVKELLPAIAVATAGLVLVVRSKRSGVKPWRARAVYAVDDRLCFGPVEGDGRDGSKPTETMTFASSATET